MNEWLQSIARDVKDDLRESRRILQQSAVNAYRAWMRFFRKFYSFLVTFTSFLLAYAIIGTPAVLHWPSWAQDLAVTLSLICLFFAGYFVNRLDIGQLIDRVLNDPEIEATMATRYLLRQKMKELGIPDTKQTTLH